MSLKRVVLTSPASSEVPLPPLDVLRNQIQHLLRNEMFDSAYTLSQFLETASGSKSDIEHVTDYCLLGDSLYGMEEYKRAIQKYKMSIYKNRLTNTSENRRSTTKRKQNPNESNKSESKAESSIRLSTEFSSPSFSLDTDSNEMKADSFQKKSFSEREMELKIKLSKCYRQLGDTRNEMKELSFVNAEELPIGVRRRYAKLLESTDPVKAKKIYLSITKETPHAIHAVMQASRLGAQVEQIQKATSKQGKWYQKVVDTHLLIDQHQHREALLSLNSLLSMHPRNLHLILWKAHIQLQLSDPDSVRETLECARDIDPLCCDRMDMLAWILRMRCKTDQLTKLSLDLMNNSPKKPESWVAAALYADEKNNKEKSLNYLEKALALNPQHVTAYLVKGFITLSLGKAKDAIGSYVKANEIEKRELSAYQGLVEAYLATQQFREALLTAKMAMDLMPRNPKALTMVGMVLSHSTEARPNARKVFKKALSIDPNCIDTVMALSKLCIVERKFDEAITLLENHLLIESKDFLHTKLAQAYVYVENVDKAMYHYQQALCSTPNFVPAVQGMEKLQSMMKGENDEEDEEGLNVSMEEEDSEEFSYN